MKALTYFRKRGLALFLALAMCLTVLPGVALAEGEIDLEPVLEGEQTDAAPAPAPQSDEQTANIQIFLDQGTSTLLQTEEGWQPNGGGYFNLGTGTIDTSLFGNVNSVGTSNFTAEQASALRNLLSNITFTDSTKTVNTDMLDSVKLSKQTDGWHLDVKYSDEAKKQDSVYAYLDTSENRDKLPESTQELLDKLPGLREMAKDWATLGKIERVDLTKYSEMTDEQKAQLAEELAKQILFDSNNPNFTAFNQYEAEHKSALNDLLESLTWSLSSADGANYGNGPVYVANGKDTYHLNGTITYYTVSYANDVDGECGEFSEGVPVLMNKSISEFQNTLEGYTFGGWYIVNDDGTQTPFDFSAKITKETQLIARWTTPTPEEPEIFIPIEFPDDIAPTPGTTTTIEDEETPLAGSVGLNNTDHFAYIEGYNDGTVRPLDNMTRAEAVTIFFRLMDDAYRLANWSTENRYTDVNAGDWYNNAVSTCVNAGILDAFTGSEFLPNQPITRAEFAVIAAGFAGEEFTGESVGDFDDTAGHWAAAEIRKAAEAGWVHGDKGSFQPDELITRADVVTLVNNMLDRVPDAEHMLPEMKTFSDNIEGEWYYEAIQEAANGHEYERDELGVVETWTELQAERDWAALEAEWAAAAAAEEE